MSQMKPSDDNLNNVDDSDSELNSQVDDTHGTGLSLCSTDNDNHKKESISFHLFTIDGQRLIYPETIPQGRKKSVHLPALLSFDPQVRKLMLAAKQDDPFADQMLLNLETQINAIKQNVNYQKESISRNIKEAFLSNGAELKINKDSYIKEIEIETNNALTTEALWLVIACDRLFFTVFMASKHNVISPKTAKMYQSDIKTLFRNMLRTANYWKQTGITRTDIAQGTAASKAAIEMNHRVKIQADVLLLKTRALCSPLIVTRFEKGLTDEEDKLLNQLVNDSSKQKNDVIHEEEEKSLASA